MKRLFQISLIVMIVAGLNIANASLLCCLFGDHSHSMHKKAEADNGEACHLSNKSDKDEHACHKQENIPSLSCSCDSELTALIDFEAARSAVPTHAPYYTVAVTAKQYSSFSMDIKPAPLETPPKSFV